MERIFCFFFSPEKLFSAKLTQVHIIRGRCQPRILVFTRMQIRFLWFCRYVVLDMNWCYQGREVKAWLSCTLPARKRLSDKFIIFHLNKFHSVLFNTTTEIPKPVEFTVELWLSFPCGRVKFFSNKRFEDNDTQTSMKLTTNHLIKFKGILKNYRFNFICRPLTRDRFLF